jgi:uncharacterized protein YgiM (DUF1202 family)
MKDKSYNSVLKAAFGVLGSAPGIVSGTEQIYKDLFATTGSTSVSNILRGINAKVCTSSGNLNYRASPGLNGHVLGKLPSNSSVTLTGISDGLWVEAMVNSGQKAWVHSAYLRNE